MNASPRGYIGEFVSFANEAYAALGKLVERLDVLKRVTDVLNNSGANGAAFHCAFDRVRGAKRGEELAIEKADAAARAALNIQP